MSEKPMQSIQSDSSDPVFDQEQRRLSQLYATLQTMEHNLTEKMDKASKNAAADKLAMCEDLSLNLASDDDAMETYANFATVNQVVDAYNIAQSVDAEKLESIHLLLERPYFAKVVLQFKPGQEPKELYIGAAGVSDELCRRLVVDWRSPVAEVYYNQDEGATSYQADGRTINVDLKLRRQFDIQRDKLNGYFDTSVAIQDALLLASLSKQRSAKMQTITATIQKEQNTVIRHEDVPVLLVNGIAGSGKTSVLMQRIAYLFYRQRDQLDPSQVFLISPNPVFSRYIDNVLPDLGERNPECLTWDEFLSSLMPPERCGGSVDVSLDVLQQIDTACEGVVLDERDFREIRCEGKRLISPGQIQKALMKFGNVPMGAHRIVLVREELKKRLRTRLAQIATSDDILNEISVLTPNEQMKLFHETFNVQDEDEARIWARRWVDIRFADAIKAVENDDWLRIDRIGMRVLGVENLLPVEWLYLKMALTGLGNPDAKYVMIDEVQDYSLAQLAVLARYFRRARFMLLGDQNQAIKSNTASFNEIRDLFKQLRGTVDECRLMTSYRSTPQITSLFARLIADSSDRLRASSIQREETAPDIRECASKEEAMDILRKAINQAQNQEGLTAVIAPHRHAAKQLNKHLGDAALPFLDADGTLPLDGVVLTTLKLAKGLEFDRVIIPDASESVFPDDPLSRRRLYTTISRATRWLILISEGVLTPLLHD